jgi:hypothetical protein
MAVPGERFDAETLLCVSCHFEAGRFRGVGGGFVRHPVGLPVPAHVRRGDGSGAVVTATDPAGWEDAITLPLAIAPGGRDVIGCGTCHALHGNPHPDLLRWAPAGIVTACSSCHRASVSPLASRD